MFVDARSLPAGEKLEADICIVGAGPAGIAMATALSGMERRIVLAESGGIEFSEAAHALNDGQSVGLSYRLKESRERYFGGAGNTWAGNCRALDAAVFQPRSWLPHSGWPFARPDLDRHYEMARALCGVARQAPGLDDVREAGGAPMPWTEPLATAVWQVSPLKPFGESFRSALTDAPGVTVLLNANLGRLATQPDGRSIATACFDTFTGRRLTVVARAYVLACGGIENPRLLLNMATEQHPEGLGNQHGLVGRFFTEHPEMPVGALIHNRPSPAGLRHFIALEAGALAEGFRISDAAQRSRQIADVAFWPLHAVEIAQSPGLVSDFGPLVQDLSSRLAGLSPSGPRTCTMLTISFEQSPNPDSRITLSDDRDALGMRRVRLDWRLNDLDRRTFATALRIMAGEAGRQRMGRFWLRAPLRGLDLDRPDTIRLDIPINAPSLAHNQLDTELRWGCHHMGTTRMHDDPRRGVVDKDARVHGISNLYVAGCSVFPSAGISNPTLTIVALALRLADHLKSARW